MKNVFITDLRGFANPAIAERLGKAGARVVGCDPAIARDGDELGVEVLGWASPADLVSRAAERFDGRLDAIVISPAMPAPRKNVEDLGVEQLMPYFQRLAAESIENGTLAHEFVKAMTELEAVVSSGRAHIGVIATPAESAQDVADRLVAAGVRSILNFAPVVLATIAQLTRNIRDQDQCRKRFIHPRLSGWSYSRSKFRSKYTLSINWMISAQA